MQQGEQAAENLQAAAEDLSQATAEADTGVSFSPQEVQGLKELFGQSTAGAQNLLGQLSQGPVTIPEGVTTQTLQNYATVAQDAIDSGIDKIGVQALRLQAINQILGK